MKEKLVLELLAKGRLSVEESAALLGLTQQLPTVQQARKPLRRRNKVQSVYTIADHMRFVNTYLDCDADIKIAAEKLGITVTTLRNHIQYAGLATLPNDAVLRRVMTWRRNHKMYLHLPGPQVQR